MCEVLDAFHYDVSLSKYTETQTGRDITDSECNGADRASSDVIPESERPTELSVSHVPVPLEPAADNEGTEVITDDVDEGIEVSLATE